MRRCPESRKSRDSAGHLGTLCRSRSCSPAGKPSVPCPKGERRTARDGQCGGVALGDAIPHTRLEIENYSGHFGTLPDPAYPGRHYSPQGYRASLAIAPISVSPLAGPGTYPLDPIPPARSGPRSCPEMCPHGRIVRAICMSSRDLLHGSGRGVRRVSGGHFVKVAAGEQGPGGLPLTLSETEA